MNTNSSLVSIIIPAYNHGKYVLKALESVLDDNYKNKELVIIDDGSTDETNNLISIWIENHKNELNIKYKSRNNRGVSKTLNELIEMADGEYICIIASDDYLLNNGIRRRVEYLENNITKMAVFGDCIVVNQDNVTTYQSALKDYYKANLENYKDDNRLKNEIIMRWSVPGPVFMARKDLYTKYKIFYNEKLIGEDWDMFLKLVSKNYLGFVDFKVSAYRLHNSNTCISFENKILLDRVKTIFYNINLYKFTDKTKLIYVLFRFNIKLFNSVLRKEK